MGNGRVFVIGLDGGSWNVIDPLIAKGLLPHLERLRNESAWGLLRSTTPPVTCPAWFTFSTGVSPNRLGMYEFRGIPPATNRVAFYNYRNLEQPEFWDLLMQLDYSCGIVNEPLVYPLKEHRGYIVPGFITPQDEMRTYPEGLGRELDEVTGGYEMEQPAGFVVDDDTLLNGCSRINRKRLRAVSYLHDAHPTDFFLGVYTSTDRICHRFMNRAVLGKGEESEEGWDAISRIYTEVDEGIGQTLERMSEDDSIMIMSDHGFAARAWNVHVNQFLEEEGLLDVKVKSLLDRLGLTQRRLLKPLLKLGIADLVYRLTPGRLRGFIPTGESRFGEYFVHELIDSGRLDWSGTSALALGAGVYLNTMERPQGILSPAQAERIKRRIKSGLEALRDPEGKGGGIRVLEPEEVYGGGEIKDAPDLLLEGEGDWEISTNLPASGEIFTPNRRAGHRLHGIFMLRHPQVKPGRLDGHLGIEDLAPIILHLYGIPTPAHMDGKVRMDLFLPGTPLRSEPRGKPDAAFATLREEDRVKRRIAQLRERGEI